MADIDGEVDRDLDPFRAAVGLLRTIPGIGDLSAQAIVAEIGTDMSRFPAAAHLVSWAGLCPRDDESAGKRRSNRLRKGDPRLKTALVRCAWAATREKGSRLQAQVQRLRHRRGPKKAVCAVAASMLTAAFHMLRDGTLCQGLGPDHFQRTSPESRADRLAGQIQRLGFHCTIGPAQPEGVSIRVLLETDGDPVADDGFRSLTRHSDPGESEPQEPQTDPLPRSLMVDFR